MLSVHSGAGHVAPSSQLGPPSVARMTKVLPDRPSRDGVSATRVAAVGVPPAARMLPSCNASAGAVGPAVPAGTSPFAGANTCSP